MLNETLKNIENIEKNELKLSVFNYIFIHFLSSFCFQYTITVN